MNFWLVSRICRVFLLKGSERGGRGAGKAQQGGPEPLSQYESLVVLLKRSIQKTSAASSLFPSPLCSLRINLCSVSLRYGNVGFPGLHGVEGILLFVMWQECFGRFFWHLCQLLRVMTVRFSD